MNLLILSIGSNPMPNYIVADYLLFGNRDLNELPLLPKPDKIMFVYSSDTEKFKDSIIDALNLESETFIEVNLFEKIREFNTIKTKVLEALQAIDGEISSIHLNYTGGTKPMAVGLSSAVEKFETCNNKIYSDLSPDKFKLTLHDGNEYPSFGDIRCFVNLSVEKIYKLHKLEKPKFTQSTSNWYSLNFIDFLINMVNEDKKGDKKFYKQWGLWPKKNRDKENKNGLKRHPEFEKLSEDEYNNFKGSLKDSVKKYITKEGLQLQELNGLKDFVYGHWLEEYLFATIEEIKKDCKITDIAWNVETLIERRPFEIDVIAVKGCQSFVFTCTIGYKSGLCKGKAFEGIYRSEQIGGEHSKTILVCMADNFDNKGKKTNNSGDQTVENIKKDMSQFDAANNFYILGSEDIQDRETFKDKLKNIINGEE